MYKDQDAVEVYDEWFERLESGESYSEIADWLNATGVPTGPYCKSDKWDCAMVTRITHNPILKGVRVRNNRKSKRLNSTGRYVSVKADPSERLERHCPHLEFIAPVYFNAGEAMKRTNRIATPIIAMLTALMIGCNEDENKALLEMSQEHQRRMEENNRRLDEMRQEVAEGSKRLVEADAEARKEIVALQRDVQTERMEVGVKRDELETERREIARQRYFDPLIASAITSAGFLIVSVLPLVLCWYLLRRPVEPADDQAVAELLLEDLVSDQPLLLPPSRRLAIEDRPTERSPGTDEHSS